MDKKHIPYFYAAVTQDAVGIFTSWDNAKSLVHGRPSKHKKFVRYYDALDFIKTNLSVEIVLSLVSTIASLLLIGL